MRKNKKQMSRLNFMASNNLKHLVCCSLAVSLLLSCSDDDTPGSNEGGQILAHVSVPAKNPWLAQETYSITHFNSAQTDAFPFAVKDGVFDVNFETCAQAWAGPVNLMTLASTSSSYMWGMSSDRVSYLHVANGKLERLAECALPGVTPRTQDELKQLTAAYTSYDELEKAVTTVLGEQPQMSMSNGNYVVCDKENYVYSNAGRKLARYRLKQESRPEEGIEQVGEIDLTPHIASSFTLVGVSMTYDGYLVVAAQKALLTLTRDLSVVDTYLLPEGQILTNSISLDEQSLYVASNSTQPDGKGLMQRIICKGGRFSTAASDGAWQAAYDGGPMAPSIKLGYGTGSTPTLMGFGHDEDKLVVITDGAKRMKLVAFWREDIPADAKASATGDPRIAGVFDITCGLPASTERIQSEQSVVVGGYDAFVVNNISSGISKVSDKIVGVLAIGPILQGPKGVECVRWNTQTNKWEARWTRSDISSVSMIPAVSTASDMVLVDGWYDATGWEVTGLDWGTGRTRHQVRFGKDNRGNGAYAIIQYLPNGDLLFNSVAGPMRIALQ